MGAVYSPGSSRSPISNLYPKSQQVTTGNSISTTIMTKPDTARLMEMYMSQPLNMYCRFHPLRWTASETSSRGMNRIASRSMIVTVAGTGLMCGVTRKRSRCEGRRTCQGQKDGIGIVGVW
ncbi:hypothetical protein QC761_407088 [Podospora bellae-mahoneyi]|uniref:Uncharacterized protein n=1 Tax=Podospora bellae-mahoneyi TaxID=2093777 RepID=A0ABR0FKL7_9PEZI|nr:hypothetical protein QC761_407088 [Podospora bellae-mahoneyi]